MVAPDQGLPIGDGDWRRKLGLRALVLVNATIQVLRVSQSGCSTTAKPAALLLVALASRWQPVDLTSCSGLDLSRAGRVDLDGARLCGSDLAAFITAHRCQSGQMT